MFSFRFNDFVSAYGEAFGVPSATQTAGLQAILDAVQQDPTHWANLQQVAYGLATFYWETAHTFRPICERGPHAYFDRYNAGTAIGNRLGNLHAGDGFLFRGRGYVQITGRNNYLRIGTLLGIDLCANPELALDVETAYRIAAGGMQQGWFTSRNLNHFLPTGGVADYLNARRIINGQDHAEDIANIAKKMERTLEFALEPASVAANA